MIIYIYNWSMKIYDYIVTCI